VRVLVVGGGIAGLATARALSQVGIECDVVEREHGWSREGMGIYLPANAIRALRLLGIPTLVADMGAAVIPSQRFLDHRGRLLVDIDLADVWGNEDPCRAMPRSALHDALGDGLAQSVRMGTTVTALRTDQDRVEVTTSDGTTASYDLVVGADGIHSQTRRLLLGGGDDEALRRVGQVAWRFITECSEVTTWSVLLGRGSTFLTIPIGGGKVYCYADTSMSGVEKADLASLFTVFAEPVTTILASLDGAPVHRSVIEEVVLSQWVHGRVLLIGDAAHATSSNMAQGAGMAMEDGLVLARCLREAPDVDAGLTQFQQVRRPRTDWVREQTHRRDHTRNLPPVIRNAALRLAGRRIFRANYAPLVAPP